MEVSNWVAMMPQQKKNIIKLKLHLEPSSPSKTTTASTPWTSATTPWWSSSTPERTTTASATTPSTTATTSRCSLRLSLWLRQEARKRQQFHGVDIELVAFLVRCCNDPFHHLHREIGFVDGAEDLVDLADLSLVLQVYGRVEVGHLLVGELRHRVSLARVHERRHLDDLCGRALVAEPAAEPATTASAAEPATAAASASTSAEPAAAAAPSRWPHGARGASGLEGS